ncbi:endogenous retrovirus group K member 8 Gag polyprotein-like [Vulpes lagopus]|uniref:endogenous retrovirus group K member 8 Gag polyprotein-like n=1 Tax=Vulpes lagopus TaxID=494514 RepID=UPI001BC94C25|nr:endogenous retrovirus group K member 8 Gag polyprotein-like [Vulpes lagopus]
MGQKQSANQVLFIAGLQTLLGEGGFKVPNKTLRSFFETVRDLCPWFLTEGSLDLKHWRRIEQELKNQISLRGETAVPAGTMRLFEQLRQVIDPLHKIKIISLKSETENKNNQFESKFEGDSEKIQPPSAAMRQMALSSSFSPGSPPAPAGDHSWKVIPEPPGVIPPAPPPISDPTKTYGSHKAGLRGPPLLRSGEDEFGDDDVYLNNNNKSPPKEYMQMTKFSDKGQKKGPVPGYRDQTTSPLPLYLTNSNRRDEIWEGAPAVPPQTFPIIINQQSAGGFDIKGVTPLQRALYEAERRGENTTGFTAFPVSLDNAGRRMYSALNFKVLKKLKTACAQYGPTAPFTLFMLDNLSRETLCPGDWHVVAKACLSGGDYLI